jgi:hypothetical protein
MKGDFGAADSNHDGRVSFDEFAAYARQKLEQANGRRAQRFKQLSSQQQTNLLRERFDKADRRVIGKSPGPVSATSMSAS